MANGHLPAASVPRPGSGEYSRAIGCDSLYPSGLWEHEQSGDHYMRRTTSSTVAGLMYDASDKTPIIGDGASLGGESEDDAEFRSRTVVRPSGQDEYPPDYGLPIPIPIPEETAVNPSGGVRPIASPVSNPQLQMNAMNATAKSMRVRHHGVPVLPPVTALKRVLSNNRNSPDEGYQEGCGTDV